MLQQSVITQGGCTQNLQAFGERGEKPSKEAATELGSCPGLRADRGLHNDIETSFPLGSKFQHELWASSFSGFERIDASSSRAPACCLRAPSQGAAIESSGHRAWWRIRQSMQVERAISHVRHQRRTWKDQARSSPFQAILCS